jgi:Protein of unknown function (DUF3800)
VSARALGGGLLKGTKLVRFAFLDEGGIAQHEPYAVVAGMFVHGDEQVIPLENRLEELVQKHIPENDREGFVFHAADIWGGGKYFKDKDVWPWERRAEILDDLVAIPGQLEIPVVYSWITKAERRPHIEQELRAKGREPRPYDFEIAYHSIAFASCVLRIEQMMRDVWPDEIAQVIAEDNSDARKSIKGVLQILKSPARIKAAGLTDVRMLPLQRIRGSVQFAEKSENRPLQLADTCAFIIRRRYYRHNERSARFYDKLKPWMMVLPHEDARPEPPEIKTHWPFGPLVVGGRS